MSIMMGSREEWVSELAPEAGRDLGHLLDHGHPVERAISDACSETGTTTPGSVAPVSSTALVISSMSKGTPSVRAAMTFSAVVRLLRIHYVAQQVGLILLDRASPPLADEGRSSCLGWTAKSAAA
jgi:hypothetical protein